MTRRARVALRRRQLEPPGPVVGGTDLWFAELNRDRPDMSAMDGLVYSITPQVHTFDEASIAQSLEAQPETVKTATTFAGGLPVVVSPVTLRPRDAVHVDHFNARGHGHASVLRRSSPVFALRRGLDSGKHRGARRGAGAASLTYYETVGWRGIIPATGRCPQLFVGPPPGARSRYSMCSRTFSSWEKQCWSVPARQSGGSRCAGAGSGRASGSGCKPDAPR